MMRGFRAKLPGFVVLAVLMACQAPGDEPVLSIIPEPQQMTFTGDLVDLTDTTGLIRQQVDAALTELGEEGYELLIGSDGVEIRAATDAGAFYAMQTLDQILSSGESDQVPAVHIRDWPAFAWRGGMLDVSRHFFPKEFILKYIDMLAFHKLNHFHWHLTDGVAWRLEISAYPELTDSVDSYSRADVEEIIAYANSRHIRIIPEIEMPGHSEAALEIFPHICCTPEDPTGIFCAGKEETFDFLETVLEEVIALFPTDLIHVGGDEVGKGQWKACSRCQQRMREEELADEAELQSYFMKRMAAFLDERGKAIIGWDEILEGGLPAGARVMSWRGMQGGLEAAELGHAVVMSPGYPCYLDHYQSPHDDEPQAWGGLNGIRDLYGFDPVPAGLPASRRHLILGGQANLWTEKVATPEHAQYMLLPRYSALAEVLWSGEAKSSWEVFQTKLAVQLRRYESAGFVYANGAFSPWLKTRWLAGSQQVEVILDPEVPLFPVFYTLDGREPGAESVPYEKPVLLKGGETLRARAVGDTGPLGFEVRVSDLPNLATGKKVRYFTDWEDSYPGDEEKTLTDARLASKRGDHRNWQGFRKNDLDVQVDLGQNEPVSRVWVRFFQHPGMTRVMFPQRIRVLGSADGKTTDWTEQVGVEMVGGSEARISVLELRFDPKKARYIRIQAENMGVLPADHRYGNLDAWIFADELGVH